jgi:hypothetical protein
VARVSPFRSSLQGYDETLTAFVATNIRVLNAHLKPIDGQGESDVLCDPRSFTDGTANLGFKCANGPFVPT